MSPTRHDDLVRTAELLRATARSSYRGRHRATRRPRLLPSRPGVRTATMLTLGATVTSLAAAASFAVAAPASDASDPVGAMTVLRNDSQGITMAGWAMDPNSRHYNVTVSAVLDGWRTLASAKTTRPYPAATSRYGAGATPGYKLTFTPPAGRHTVCLVMGNVGAGTSRVGRCLALPWGRTLSPSEKAAHSPLGAMNAVATPDGVRVAGWALDPDLRPRRSRVELFVDGASTTSRWTFAYPAAKRPTGAGARSRFDMTVPVSAGTHIACLSVRNVAIGRNASLGCKAVDTRSPYGAQPRQTAAPALNAQIAAFAKKQIGKSYVWGAVGPRSFDCSGLVVWAYGKVGRTPPRVSQDQAKAARLIPASHARAGDLVFYHDASGDVYHVGIFLRPGMTVAAIDTSQGVDYQPIWNPDSATYGSLTHT